MNGRERLLTFFNNEPIDRLPLMPITMMFAADQIEVNYKNMRWTIMYWCRRRLQPL